MIKCHKKALYIYFFLTIRVRIFVFLGSSLRYLGLHQLKLGLIKYGSGFGSDIMLILATAPTKKAGAGS